MLINLRQGEDLEIRFDPKHHKLTVMRKKGYVLLSANQKEGKE